MSSSIASAKAVLRLLCTLLLAASPVAAADKKTPTASKSPRTYAELFDRIERGKSDGATIPASGPDRLMGMVAYWLAVQKGQKTSTLDELIAFVRQHPDWPGLTAFRRRIDELLALDLSDDKALEWFNAYPPVTRDGRLRFAEAKSARGHSNEADAIIRRVWREESFSLTEEKAFLERFGFLLTLRDHEARLERQLWRNQDEAAARQLAYVDALTRQTAEARLALRSSSPKASALLEALPSPQAKSAGILYERIRFARHQNRHDEARSLLLEAPAELVRPDLWWVEREIQIRRAILEGDSAMAYRLARNHGLSGGVELAEAEFLAGYVALRLLQDAKTALTHFQTLFENSQMPVSLARGAYWVGMSAEALNRPEEAKQWHKKAAANAATFYGQLANARLGASSITFAPAPKPSKSIRDAFEQRDTVRIVRQLAKIGAAERTDPFLYRLIDLAGSPDIAVLIAELARSIGRIDLAVAIARRVQKDVLLVQEGYPHLPFDAEPSVETALIHAVIRQESNFSPVAVSRVGARGLMQLMPTTAKQIAAKQGQPYTEARLTEDPRYNLALGQSYLGQLIDRFEGSYVLAIASYNAGPGRVQQWLRQNGDPRSNQIDMLDWIERIPFSETRNYVQRVLEGTLIYRHTLQRPAPNSSTPLIGNWCILYCALVPSSNAPP